MNREEAERCVQIARAAVEAGDSARARKFLLIAQRLRPEDREVEQLLADLQQKPDSAASAAAANGDFEDEATASSTANGTTSGEPSPEQVQIVARINRTVDYYEILGLAKACSEDEIRKAYRKLSLKVHPDKNKAPGAEEAFKLVSKAFQCLSSSEHRQKYDVYGAEDRIQHHGGMRNRRYQQQRGYDFFDDGFDPDEIFQAFFFGGQGGPAGFRRQNFVRTPPAAGRQGEAGTSFNVAGIIHLVLIVIVLVFSAFPSSSPPDYSLHRQTPYVHPMSTSSRGVAYYVRASNFNQDHPPGSHFRKQVETQVEKEYRETLVHNCRNELYLRSWGQIAETPHCKQLEKFNSMLQQQQQPQQQHAY